MRTKLKVTEGIFPMPVLMVATYDLQKLMSEIEDISCNNEWCHIKGKVPLNTSKTMPQK